MCIRMSAYNIVVNIDPVIGVDSVDIPYNYHFKLVLKTLSTNIIWLSRICVYDIVY